MPAHVQGRVRRTLVGLVVCAINRRFTTVNVVIGVSSGRIYVKVLADVNVVAACQPCTDFPKGRLAVQRRRLQTPAVLIQYHAT